MIPCFQTCLVKSANVSRKAKESLFHIIGQTTTDILEWELEFLRSRVFSLNRSNKCSFVNDPLRSQHLCTLPMRIK